jgi:small subunit ribosomal protein S14
MAKISVIQRNLKRIRMAEKFAAKREELKASGDWEGLQKLPRNSAPTRIRLRCSVTGRGRGVYRKFGVCRNQLRQLALDGKLPGVHKASW